MSSQKNLITILFIITIISSCKNKAADLVKFESILGYEKSKVLTELTEDFENGYLAKKHPNHDLPDRYLRFMEGMANSNWPEKNEVISKK